MKFFVLALFLSQSVALEHTHQAHHRHQMRHRSTHQTIPTFSHKPNFDQFLALNSAERSQHKMQAHGKSQAEERGILEKVQQKFEKEEKEKEQIRIAKEAKELQEKAFKEAELISQHKIMQNVAQEQEALAQATTLVEMIKKGNVSAEQLSQIMLGQLDLATFVEDDSTPAPVAAPLTMPALAMPAIAMPALAAPIEQPPKPAVQQSVIKAPEVAVKVEAVQKKAASVPEVQQKAPERQQPQQHNILPAALPQMPEPRGDELEDSISSIAQRVVDEKNQKEAKVGQSLMNELSDGNTDMPEQPKKMTMSERAENKFIKNDPEASKEIQAEEALDNPISEYFANKHPEVVETAQERHYLTDKV